MENGVIYTASKKEFLAISVKDNKKTVLKHVGRYCEIADLKYENLSNVRQEKKGENYLQGIRLFVGETDERPVWKADAGL